MAVFFKKLHQSKKSKARLGEIKTSHGAIKTPAFMAAGTKGTIKALPTQFIKDIGIQVGFVNTYHLVTHPGVDVVEKAGGIHKFANLDIPLMSDSGGFQVFSLARDSKARHHPAKREVSSLLTYEKKADIRGEEQPLVVKISDDGVKFRSTYDGKLIEFTPEKSIEYQQKIGADIIMTFDECTYYPSTHEYAEKAMRRTQRWLERCVDYKARHHIFSPASPQRGPRRLAQKQVSSLSINPQFLYGIIQGGVYENLRKKSAEFVVSHPVDGVAIGGVSVGESKKEMREQVRWVADYLPEDKPVHLLGVGQFDDIVDLVKYGVDTFDCVEPTRLARMGHIYQTNQARHRVFSSASPPKGGSPKRLTQKQVSSLSGKIDILKTIYKNDLEPVDKNCDCYTCANFTKAYLHHLFKQKEILGYTLATYHNLWVMEKFFEKIRGMIVDGII